MSRGIRKTGIFIAVMLTVVVLTGCQIAKKDESGQAKEELYGAYAVVELAKLELVLFDC